MTAGGPLAGVRVVKLAGIGPAPFCGMLLSDLGADVVLVDRPGPAERDATAVTYRGWRHVVLDLKHAEDRDACLALIERADMLIEGFRPGVTERLGLGPDAAFARNPRLVYGRMTGWGQSGPFAHTAGHDINFIAISGALHAIGPADRPIPPLNLVGDFGGGALYLAFGMLAALLHARATGEGQVVDGTVSDGTASLMAMAYGCNAAGRWIDDRDSNRLDGAAPFYGAYRCADGHWISIGSIEPAIHARLLDRLGIGADDLPDRADLQNWPAVHARFAECFSCRPREEWNALLRDSDVCFAPILSMAEAPLDPHNAARGTFVTVDGVTQPAVAPRLGRTPGAIQMLGWERQPAEAVRRAWSQSDPRPS